MAPKAKVNGKVSKIEIRYNCPFKDLSSSLKKVIKQTDEHMINTYGYTGEVLTNNYTFEGKPLVEGQVQIKIYIISNINFTTADKGVWGNQMKFVISRVFDEDIYTEDGTKIDAKFSFRSINNRIAGSPLLLGTTCMVLEKLTDKITEMYFE